MATKKKAEKPTMVKPNIVEEVVSVGGGIPEGMVLPESVTTVTEANTITISGEPTVVTETRKKPWQLR